MENTPQIPTISPLKKQGAEFFKDWMKVNVLGSKIFGSVKRDSSEN